MFFKVILRIAVIGYTKEVELPSLGITNVYDNDVGLYFDVHEVCLETKDNKIYLYLTWQDHLNQPLKHNELYDIMINSKTWKKL
jgi:hypothetical protein